MWTMFNRRRKDPDHHRSKPHQGLLVAVLAATVLLGCSSTAPPDAGSARAAASTSADAMAARQLLAPTGRLRIAVYPGSPTSLVRSSGGEEDRGVSVEVGRELARRLGVPADLVVFDRVALVVDAVHQGQADMTITNATAARAALVDFTAPLVGLELGYLVPAGSPLQTLEQVDRAGLRIGVSLGSSSQASLSKTLRNASLVTAESLTVAAQQLANGQLDAFATNKGILFELSDKVPGSRVLDGRWGVESLALAVPPGRGGAATFLAGFVADPATQGLVQQAAARAGLRGVTAAQRQ